MAVWGRNILPETKQKTTPGKKKKKKKKKSICSVLIKCQICYRCSQEVFTEGLPFYVVWDIKITGSLVTGGLTIKSGYTPIKLIVYRAFNLSLLLCAICHFESTLKPFFWVSGLNPAGKTAQGENSKKITGGKKPKIMIQTHRSVKRLSWICPGKERPNGFSESTIQIVQGFSI